jgi:hypothetical protein
MFLEKCLEMANLNSTVPLVVVYKTIVRKKEKYHLIILENTRVDDIIDKNKRKSPIPNDAEIIEIGVGLGFEERYRKRFKL